MSVILSVCISGIFLILMTGGMLYVINGLRMPESFDDNRKMRDHLKKAVHGAAAAADNQKRMQPGYGKEEN
ncbi:MAG: hypothetical protein GF398_09505 [Chitinivibrionales bacterium]|nr:hypothetical protein [Chitinivibrionales bacterium]